MWVLDRGAAVKRHHFSFTLFAAWLSSVPLAADDGVFDQYRDLMGDDNPAVFVIDEGEELWFRPQGPESATLEACDLGLGPGSLQVPTCAFRATLPIPTR